MRRRTKVVLVAAGAIGTLGIALVLGNRLLPRRNEQAQPDEDAFFTVYAPGGSQAIWANGPVGWLISKLMPIVEAGVYRSVAEMLDLRPGDELLDIGCGPGGFLAAEARHVHRIVGLDISPLMLRAAERRLGDRIAAGTAQLVLGNATALPFGDGAFSAVTAIYAPARPAEVFRVLRPGGRFVAADPDPARTPAEHASPSWGRWRRNEADYRRMFDEAGFTDLTVQLGDYGIFISGRKPGLVVDEAAPRDLR